MKMKFFDFGLFIFFVVKCVQCADDLWSDVDNVGYALEDNGRLYNLRDELELIKVIPFNETLYSNSLSELHNITKLKLRCSNIRMIEKGSLCVAPDVKTLKIDFFFNKKAPALTKDTFENCTNIEELLIRLNDEEPSTIASDALENVPNLKKLGIQHYNITHLKKGFFGVTSKKLESLILSTTSIMEVDGNSFEDFENLKKIVIIRNREWSYLPSNLFRGLSKLKTLSLNNNGLENVTWDEFEGLSLLEELDISENRITSFDADKVAKHLPSLRRLAIYLNLASCKKRHVFAERLKAKLNNLKFKSDPDFWDSCEDEE